MSWIDRVLYYIGGSFSSAMMKKLMEVSHKHDPNKEVTLEMVQAHLVEEILELFLLTGTAEGILVEDILRAGKIDTLELVDVANCCGIYQFIYDRSKPNEST